MQGVFWNKEAKQRFNWYLTELAANTAKEYPRSSFRKNIRTSQEKTHHQPCLPRYFKSKREDVTGQERGQNANVHLQPWDDKQFELKCPVMLNQWHRRIVWFPLGFMMWATVLRPFGYLASLDGPFVTNSLFSQTCLSTISSGRWSSRRFLLAWRGSYLQLWLILAIHA